MRRMLLTLLLCMSRVTALQAQNDFVYTNNERIPINTVSAFRVDSHGVLTQLPESPYITGGMGASGGTFASKHLLAIPQGFLFVANGGSQTISAFSVDPSTGALATVPGSPFPTGEPVVAFEPDISLAATPDGKYLLSGHGSSGHLDVYSVSSNGSLTRTAGSPFNVGISLAGMSVTPNGHFLAIAKGASGVAMFAIAADGSLTPIAGTPIQVVPPGFPNAIIFSSGVDCNCSSTRLYEAKFNSVQRTIVGFFDISPHGAITPLSGSPFVFPGGANSSVIALRPNDHFAFVSNQDSASVTALEIGEAGLLTPVPGTPVAIPGPGPAFPAGMAINESGTFLFTANGATTVGVFRIGRHGDLTPAAGSPFSTGYTGFGLLSVAAFPPKSCCAAPVIDGVSASPHMLGPDHELLEVSLDYNIVAECAVSTHVTVHGVPTEDVEILDDHHVILHADKKDPTYSITVTATNTLNGRSTSAITTVTVPHGERQ